MTDEVVTAAARAAARELAPQYGARVEADVEVALYSAGKSEPPPQFFDPIALGGLIVAIATLAYQVYSDRKKDGHKPSKDTVARAVRVERRKYSDLTAAEEKIIEIVSAEIITSGDDELPGYGTESLRSRPGSVMPSSAVTRPPETVTAMSDTGPSPGDDRGQPAAHVSHVLDPGGREPQPRLLHRVVGVGQRAEHPVGDRPQVRPVLLEQSGQLAGGGCGALAHRSRSPLAACHQGYIATPTRQH